MKDEIRMKVWADAYISAYTHVKVNEDTAKRIANSALAAFDEKWGDGQPEPPQEGFINLNCPICDKPIDSLSGNPDLWGIELSYEGGNGDKRFYHRGCVQNCVKAAPKPQPDQPPLKVGDEFLHKKGVHRFTIQHTFHPIYCGEDGHGESIWMTYDDIIGDYDQL